MYTHAHTVSFFTIAIYFLNEILYFVYFPHQFEKNWIRLLLGTAGEVVTACSSVF